MMDLRQIYKQMRFKFRTLAEGMKSSVKSGRTAAKNGIEAEAWLGNMGMQVDELNKRPLRLYHPLRNGFDVSVRWIGIIHLIF
jgi:hypothetical protein